MQYLFRLMSENYNLENFVPACTGKHVEKIDLWHLLLQWVPWRVKHNEPKKWQGLNLNHSSPMH